MLPLTEASARTMHDDRLPENAYVADATLFPRSLGNPRILPRRHGLNDPSSSGPRSSWEG
jgi:hypothetical protein